MPVKALYVVCALLLNAQTGELEEEVVGNVPMTLEACNKVIVERGPMPVKDGLATFLACRKLQSGLST